MVIPNWMYVDPKQANFVGFPKAQIASKGSAFADGGSTTKASPVATTDELAGERSQLVSLVQLLVQSR